MGIRKPNCQGIEDSCKISQTRMLDYAIAQIIYFQLVTHLKGLEDTVAFGIWIFIHEPKVLL